MKKSVDLSYALYESRWGWVGLAWSSEGLCCVQLPERTREKTQKKLFERLTLLRGKQATRQERALPATFSPLKKYLDGKVGPLNTLPLDFQPSTPLMKKIYGQVRELTPGQTATYQEIARRSGHPRAARAVGTAMRRNPLPLVIPCHRILRTDGGLGGFSAWQGLHLKEQLLAAESALSS